MKLSKLIDSESSLLKLVRMNFPVKIAYKLSKVYNKIQPELKIYEEQRIRLIKELGEQTNKETDEWSVKPNKSEVFREEMQKLLDVDVDLEFGEGKEIEKIKLDDLGSINLAADDLIKLDWLFE